MVRYIVLPKTTIRMNACKTKQASKVWIHFRLGNIVILKIFITEIEVVQNVRGGEVCKFLRVEQAFVYYELSKCRSYLIAACESPSSNANIIASSKDFTQEEKQPSRACYQ